MLGASLDIGCWYLDVPCLSLCPFPACESTKHPCFVTKGATPRSLRYYSSTRRLGTPSPWGPHSAKRSRNLGHPSRGGVGNSLGRGEGNSDARNFDLRSWNFSLE